MRVLLVGPNGQLGSDLAASAPPGVAVVGVRRQQMDVTDRAAVARVLLDVRADVVINTAAFHKVEACEEEPELTFRVNAIAARDLAAVVQGYGGVLVQISSDYVFGATHPGRPFVESDRVEPLNTYGISKVAAEAFVRAATPRHYVVRMASLFGKAGASGKGGNFVTTILRKAKEGGPLRVVEDVYMSPTYTHDAARMLWTILAESYPFGTYHVVNRGAVTWCEFARRIVACAGLAVPVEGVPQSAYPSKARRPLWSPLGSERGTECRAWEEALQEYVGWVVNQEKPAGA